LLAGAGAAAVAAALTGCRAQATGAPAAAASGARGLTVLLDWFPNPDHVALYLAQHDGSFAAAGLDVTLQSPSDPADPPRLVATGKVELGISYEPEVFLSRQAGLPVTAVGALVPTALNSVLATDKSPVRSIADLAGHTVGDAGLASDTAFLKSIFARYGIDPASVRTIDLQTSLVTAMVAGTVDATIGGFRNVEAVQLQMMGLDPLVVPVTEAGIPDYDELVVIASSSRLAQEPAYRALVRDFLAALATATAAAHASPGDAIAALRPVAKGYDETTLARMVQATVPLLVGSGPPLSMDPDRWAGFGQWMVHNQLLTAAVPVPDAMTTRELPSS
jgi:putative hydroxymethylpyrimidine transport system substrate-binding protein